MTSGPSPLWYATRATGVIALVLLTATVVLGIAGTARFETPRWPRIVTSGLHRNLSLLSVVFVAAHVLTTVLDTYAPIGWAAAIVPFSSPYRTLWLGLGTVASDLLLAVVITSLLRVRLGYRSWRAVHWLSYASWPVALWHGLGTGTDSKLPWLLALDAACVTAVACALLRRLSLADRVPGPTTMLLSAALPVATAVFVLVGPLQPGWAKRAGTPQAQLAGTVTPGQPPATARSAAPAEASFTGHAARAHGPGAGQVTITITAQTSTRTPQSLVITLRGAPDGAGVALSEGTVSVRTAGAAASYQGPVVSLNGHVLVADLQGPGNSAVHATITLFVQGSAASGRLAVGSGGGE
jgi:methionine sulfoxide reductase heme-binding subunit